MRMLVTSAKRYATATFIYEPLIEVYPKQVWDNSWKVVSDQQACVKLDFPHNKPNPNQKVAQLYQYAGEKHREIGERPSFIATLAIIICCTIAVLYVAIKFICVIFSKAYYWCC